MSRYGNPIAIRQFCQANANGKYLTLMAHIALTMIVALIAITVVFQILTIRQETRTSPPIPNTTMDSDGVIRINPRNGCGPFAHVENHPKYGQLCIQKGALHPSTHWPR